MKLIELFNKIANGEEVPKKIKYKGRLFLYKEGIDYQGENGHYLMNSMACICPEDLKDEVEIIEEHKIPEKIFLEDMYSENEIKVIDIELENKINEIINYLKKIE